MAPFLNQNANSQSMIRKGMPSGYDPTGGYRFSLATNADRVCAEIMLEQKARTG